MLYKAECFISFKVEVMLKHPIDSISFNIRISANYDPVIVFNAIPYPSQDIFFILFPFDFPFSWNNRILNVFPFRIFPFLIFNRFI